MKKSINKILRFILLFVMILGISFSNGPFYAINSAIKSYIASRDIVDKAFNLSGDENVVDKFNSYRNLAEGIKIQEAHAAAGYIGNSNMIYTNGSAPGAITPNASTTDGDLLVFYHYSRAAGGNETVALPAGFTPVFNSATAGRGLVAVGWRIKQAGDGTFQATITNHSTGSTGETVIEFIQTYRGTDTANPITDYTASLSNWASSLNIGPIAAPATAIVNDGDMAVMFGGRFENITGQTALSGDSLTWMVRTTANTTSGADAGAVVQTGLNSTGASQTVTAKTVATTGTAQAGGGRMFIIKKASNTSPSLSISQPDGVGDTISVGDLYNITYSLFDAEDIVTAAFYYDTNNTGLDGTAITGACSAAAEGGGVTCSWDTTGMTPGSYYVYGITNDGVNPQVSDYSSGMITINAPAPVVTGIDPAFGLSTENNKTINFITGSNFQSNSTVKLTQGAATINQLTTFTYNTGNGNLENGSFNLTGQPLGAWDVVVTNPDFQVGTCGGCFTINAPAPIVTGIDPVYGLNTENNKTINYISGSNFQSGATVQLTHTALAPIGQLLPFTYNSGNGNLENGSFDLTSQTENLWWKVVVTNPDAQTGSYGNETTSGFEIRLSKPSIPANIYQFKANTDIAQPPTTNIAVGGGIGGQTAVYFRMDMKGGLIGRYYPQVEVKPAGAPFECIDSSPTPCLVSSGFFAENSTDIFSYDGITPVQGWVSINGVDGASYHWQARVRNSSGVSNWVSFGGNNDPNDIDFYIDNTPPVISLGTDNTCATAAPLGSITDLSALIQWNTSDNMSGAASVFPGSGAYAKAQVDYKKGIEPWSTTALSSWENSMHQAALSGLSPATVYTFRARSQDYLGNESISAECGLTTASSRPIKTVEFFIGQETDSYKNLLPDGTSKKYFTITLPESPASVISVKSAFVEITGVTSPAISQIVNVGLLRGDQTLASGPAGENYALNSDSTTTPFTVLFNALSPSGTGQESMANITTGATPYGYTLFLKGDGVTDIWLFSAKLVITYSYEL